MINFIVGFVVGGIVIYFIMLIVKPAQSKSSNAFLDEQVQKKQENLDKIKELVNSEEKITNNIVEKKLGVSNATAERYLDELEKEGSLKQVGKTGIGVYYTKS